MATTSDSRKLAWTIAAGFYPSFGEQGRIKRRYTFQSMPKQKPSIWAMGLPHKAAFKRIGGDSASYVQVKLKKILFAKGAKYTIKGHHAWWQSGIDNMSLNTLAKDLYTGMSDLPEKTNTAKAERIYDMLLKGFTDFEGSAASRTKAMVDIVTENSLKGAKLEDFAANYWDISKSDADVPEEEWEALLQAGLVDQSDVIFQKPDESLGKANKIDIKLMLSRLDKALAYDATESLLASRDEYQQGSHGLSRKMEWTGKTGGRGVLEPEFEWIEKNKPTVIKDIKDYWIKSIEEEFNPVIKEMVAYGSESLGISKAPKPEQMVGKTGGEGALITTKFLEDMVEGGEFAGFPQLAQVAQEWSNAGYKSKTDKVTKEQLGPKLKRKKLFGYLLHNIGNINTIMETDFYQTHRISKRGPYGDAWYAFIPMSMYPPDHKTDAYQFLTEGDKSPENTQLMSGPNATLSLLAQQIKGFDASLVAAYQSAFFAARRFHSSNVKVLTDGALLSTTNAESVKQNKHGVTVTYSPKDTVKFFAHFVERLTKGMTKEQLEVISDKAFQSQKGTNLKIPNLQGFDKFWALPYIAFEDNLERKSGEVYTWFNEVAEKGIVGNKNVGGAFVSSLGYSYKPLGQ